MHTKLPWLLAFQLHPYTHAPSEHPWTTVVSTMRWPYCVGKMNKLQLWDLTSLWRRWTCSLSFSRSSCTSWSCTTLESLQPQSPYLCWIIATQWLALQLFLLESKLPFQIRNLLSFQFWLVRRRSKKWRSSWWSSFHIGNHLQKQHSCNTITYTFTDDAKLSDSNNVKSSPTINLTDISTILCGLDEWQHLYSFTFQLQHSIITTPPGQL